MLVIFEAMLTDEPTRRRNLPRAKILAAFGVGLMLLLPGHALADEIVYFTNGKAMTVKKIEKGERFTILEIEGGGRIGVPNDRIARIETLQIPRPSTGAGAAPRVAGTTLRTGQTNDQIRKTTAATAPPSISPAGEVKLGAVANRTAGSLQRSAASARNLARRQPPRATGQNMRGVGPGGRLMTQGAGRFGYGGERAKFGRTDGRSQRGGRPNRPGKQGLNNPRNSPAIVGRVAGQNAPTNENDASPSDEANSEED